MESITNHSEGVKKLRGLRDILKLALIAWVIFAALLLFIPILEMTGILDLANMSPSISVFVMVVVFGFILINIMTTIIFGMWIFRASANIRDETELPISDKPGWAVGWYFIPFANWFKPFTAMRQIWNASIGNQLELDEGNSTLSTWWTFWVIGNITGYISFRMSMSDNANQMLQATQVLDIITGITSIALYFIVVPLINTITDGQSNGLHLPVEELTPEAH
jgi:hypothetical protein